MNTVYDVSYFIKKFSAIPDDKWFTGDYSNRTGDKFCALGHCGMHDGCFDKTEESSSLNELFTGFKITEKTACGLPAVPAINDGNAIEYQQPTPKQRILAALWDIKKLSYPELSETTVNDLIGEKDLHEKH